MKSEKKIKELVLRKALFVINHSGGKDSQAMFLYMKSLVPQNQILVIHADLPGADWPGTTDHVIATTIGYEGLVVRAKKTFFDMVRHRQMWPSPKYRQCTSDLKRAPIEKAIRHYLKARELSLVINCMGIRAEESSARSKAIDFKLNVKNSKAGREWYDMLPIHEWKIDEVFAKIAEAGEKPHWAYEQGMSRLSCCFCIMSSNKDLKTAAKIQPDLFEEYKNLEREIGQTFLMPSKKNGKRYLGEVVNCF